MTYPKRHMLWERRTDAYNVIVSAAMRHDCSETIFSNLHVANNARVRIQWTSFPNCDLS